MTLSYAGTDLLVLPPDVAERIAEVIDPSWLTEFTPRTWPGPGPSIQDLGWRGPTQLDFGPKQIGVLSWPMWGAQRFAIGHFCCDEIAAATIRQVAFAGGTWTSAKLVIDDGQGGIEPDMYCLPLRPLEQVAIGIPGLYLLTLVDARFLWWFRTGEFSLTEGSTTWEDLYSSLAELLEISAEDFEVDSIAAEYLSPPVNLAIDQGPVPHLLDAVAASVGQRIVYHYDGYVHAMNAETSLALHLANLSREGVSGSDFPNGRLAGNRFLVPGDWPAALPESIRLVCVKAVDNQSAESSTHTVDVALTDTNAGANYAPGVVGFSGTKTFHTTAVANYPTGSAVADNEAELEALAQRLAEDWYTWQMGRAEARYEGCAGWTPEGHTDEVRFEHDYGRISTQVFRGPWDDHLEDLFHLSSETIDDTLSAWLVTNVCPTFTTIDDGSGGGGGTGDVVGPVSSSDGGLVVFDGITGKLIKQITGTGVVHVTSGVASVSLIVTADVTDANITYAKIQDVTGLSVIGRAASTSGVTAAITAANDGEVLRRSGTSIGFGTIATAGIANAAVTYAKLQDASATARVLARKTAGSGSYEECTFSEVLDFVGSAAQGDILYRNATAWVRLGAGTSGHYLQTQGAGANPQWAATALADADYGDITVSSSGTVWTIDAAVVTYAKIQDVTGLSVVGRSANSSGVTAAITAANDAEVLRRSGTSIGFGTVATAGIADNAVTFAKIQDVAGLSVVGRSANTSGVTAAITAANDAEVLRRSGTSIGFGTVATAGIADNAVTFAKMQAISADVLLGNDSSGTAVQEITCTSFIRTLLDDTSASNARNTLELPYAAQSDMEGETSGYIVVSPSQVKYSPGVSKGWVTFDGTGTVAIKASYNVASITDNGTGDYTINWDVDFSTDDYCTAWQTMYQDSSGGVGSLICRLRNQLSTLTSASMRVVTLSYTGVLEDCKRVHVSAWGDR